MREDYPLLITMQPSFQGIAVLPATAPSYFHRDGPKSPLTSPPPPCLPHLRALSLEVLAEEGAEVRAGERREAEAGEVGTQEGVEGVGAANQLLQIKAPQGGGDHGRGALQ